MEEGKDSQAVGGQQAGYLFEFKKDGVYLTVYPSKEPGVFFEPSDMRQILKEYSVDDYDIEFLARVLRESSGKPQKLSEHFQIPADAGKKGAVVVEEGAAQVQEEQQPKNYANITVEVSKDRMAAMVRFQVQNEELVPTLEMVQEALAEKGVTYGIDKQALIDGIENGGSGNITAAQGKPPENGKDAYIERCFDLGEKGRPVANKYDQVDYKNLNLFVIAHKDDVLARRVLQTTGIAGVNVFGDEVPAKNGKPKPLPNGKHTRVENENEVVADLDGQIVDNGTKISIDPQLSINGDVGLSTGNIDFIGGVHISGSVQAGFVVKATGDIEIKGMVSGATVEGRNVFISGGVQGMNKGHILAREDVRANFVENADIEAGSNICITDVVLHSDLRAGKKVLVEGKRGQITGGSIAAGEEIRANNIGNLMYVVTRLTVGVNPMLQRKYKETCKEYSESKKKLEQLTRALNTLGKIDANKLPKERLDQINAMTRSQFPLAGLIERDEKALRDMEKEMDGMKKGKVRVADTLYPGVKMSINTILKNVQTEEKHCTLYIEDDFIKTGAF